MIDLILVIVFHGKIMGL